VGSILFAKRGSNVLTINNHVRKHEEIGEIPRSQRYINRPELFKAETRKDKHIRNNKIREAVKSYGYSQNEIAEQLGMHYSTISRLLKDGEETSKVKT